MSWSNSIMQEQESKILFIITLISHLIHNLSKKISRKCDISTYITKHEQAFIIFNSLVHYWIRAVAGQRSLSKSCFASKTKILFRAKHKRRKITELWNIGHCDLNLFCGQRAYYTNSFSKVWHTSIKYYLRYKAKSLDNEKIGYCDLHTLGSKFASQW